MSQRLRFSTAREVFEAFPAAVEDMVATPTDRPSLEFLAGLVAGPTPEDAITSAPICCRGVRRCGGVSSA
jgi:hypothetical protein